MGISIINGSPKMGKSTSALMIEYFLTEIKQQDVEVYNINQSTLSEEQISKIQNSNALIFAFPLYIDSIPAHLLRELLILEQKGFKGKDIKVYCIVNNGFYEGTQNHIAIEQMKLWCKAVNLTWGQAIGTGAGEMYPLVKDIPLGHGPNKNIGHTLKDLAHHVLSGCSGTEHLISVNWPRFLWRIQSSTLVWYPRAKDNGLNKQAMFKRMKP